MTLPTELVEYIQNNMSTSDIIHLHILVNDIYDDIKTKTKNFPQVKWAALHPQQTKLNNKIQQQKFKTKAKAKLKQNTQQNTQEQTPQNTQEYTPQNTQEYTPQNTQEYTPQNTQEYTPQNTPQ